MTKINIVGVNNKSSIYSFSLQFKNEVTAECLTHKSHGSLSIVMR